MTFLRVGMCVLLQWNRDLFHSHQQCHTTIKTEYGEKLERDARVLLGSWVFQDTKDKYTDADTCILICAFFFSILGTYTSTLRGALLLYFWDFSWMEYRWSAEVKFSL